MSLGLLSAVDSLTLTTQNSTISLTWIAPFTQNIAGVDPDIQGYCASVVYAASALTVEEICGISETEFSYPIPEDSVCHLYQFAVTPINVVGNGVRTTVPYNGSESSTLLLIRRIIN